MVWLRSVQGEKGVAEMKYIYLEFNKIVQNI